MITNKRIYSNVFLMLRNADLDNSHDSLLDRGQTVKNISCMFILSAESLECSLERIDS